MCGRFALTSPVGEIKQHFNLEQAAAALTPRYNIAPSQVIIVVKNKTLEFVNWGFRFNNTSNIIINLKMETILEKNYFSTLFKQHRCLVVVSGFFEWKLINDKKTPFYVQVKHQSTIGLAGILNKDNCAILTTGCSDPNISTRIPVIINKSNYQVWLDQKTPVAKLQHPELQIPCGELILYPVSSQVNNPKFDHEQCIRPLN